MGEGELESMGEEVKRYRQTSPFPVTVEGSV